MNDAADSRPHVLVLGGGFGGLWATRALASAPVRVTLVDRTNHHLFQPLLYQVATAGLSAPDIAAPLRHILRRQANVTVRLDEALAIDPARRRVTLAGRTPAPFRYRDYGNLATIGRMAAVVDFGRLKLSGVVAWWFWLVAHLFFLIGFRNRLLVLVNWAWSYWTYQRHARIIVRNHREPPAREPPP